MSEDNEAIADLLSKHLHNALTPAEGVQLKNWIARSRANRVKFERLTDIDYVVNSLKDYLLPQKGRKSKSPLTRFR